MGRIPSRRAAVALALWAAAPAAAQIVNGSFESGLTGWTAAPASQVEALQATNFSPTGITPPDGDFFALLTSGPGNRGGARGDFDANGVSDFDGVTLSTTFTTTVDDETLGFQWTFLTDEVGPGGQGQPLYDDLFDITIDGISIIRGSVRKPGGSSPYVDTVPYDNLAYNVVMAGATNGSVFGGGPGGGRIPFQQTCITIAAAGTYTLEFLVADQADSVFDSGLVVDAVEVASACDPKLQITVSSQSIVEAKGGVLVFSTVGNGLVEVNGDGTVLSFGSNGDYTGDNPNLQDEIWVATRNGASYDIARVTGAVGAGFGNPRISPNGRWLTFSSTGNLTSGNADGNQEIFRHDLATATTSQITSTMGCINEDPTINDDGSRIAFATDCDLGFGSTGTEIAYWDGAFSGLDTTGCDNRGPRISADAAGRYVSFVTDCDAQYAGTSNPDGSAEILQWDTQSGTYLEVTDSPVGSQIDGLASSADGEFLSFVSNADYQTGQNPSGSPVPFRYERTGGVFVQLMTPVPQGLYTVTDIDDSGVFVAAERLEPFLASFSVVLFDATLPGIEFPVAEGSFSVANNFPVVAVSNNRPLVAYLSNDNTSGNNPDLNTEIWVSGAAFDPPTVGVFCSTPGALIPDNNPQGVTDVISVPAAGILDDLDVLVRIDHTFVGDLRVDLRHLDTNRLARIVRRPGRPPGPGCSGDDIDATLDDEAGSPVEDACVTPGPVAILGSFIPDQALSRFDDEDVFGDWRLTVSDRGSGDTGTLVEWCLIPAIK